MKAINKLRSYWDKKERCRSFYFPQGHMTKCDAIYLDGVLTEEFLNELEERGYDKTTFKFSIEPKKGNVRFVSQRNEEN